jgi:hypothetical protein
MTQSGPLVYHLEPPGCDDGRRSKTAQGKLAHLPRNFAISSIRSWRPAGTKR